MRGDFTIVENMSAEEDLRTFIVSVDNLLVLYMKIGRHAIFL